MVFHNIRLNINATSFPLATETRQIIDKQMKKNWYINSMFSNFKLQSNKK